MEIVLQTLSIHYLSAPLKIHIMEGKALVLSPMRAVAESNQLKILFDQISEADALVYRDERYE